MAHLLATAVVPLPDAAVHEHLDLARLQAYESLLALAHEVIKAQVPVPGVAPVAVDAVKKQIPSNPPELHEVLVVYVEQLAFAIHDVPLEMHPSKPAKQAAVVVPLVTSAQVITLQTGVVIVAVVTYQKQIPSVPIATPH